MYPQNVCNSVHADGSAPTSGRVAADRASPDKTWLKKKKCEDGGDNCDAVRL